LLFLDFASCGTAEAALRAIADTAAAASEFPNCFPFALRDAQLKTPLHYACMRFPDAAVARALIEARADVSAIDSDGFSPLFYGSSAAVIVELLRAGAGRFCHTQLHYIEPLMIAADPALVSSRETPLHHAASGDIVDVLVAHVCAVMKNILFYAHNGDVMRRLIHHNADVNARTDAGKTPLHFVADVDTAEALLAARADVTACDLRGALPKIHIFPPRFVPFVFVTI